MLNSFQSLENHIQKQEEYDRKVSSIDYKENHDRVNRFTNTLTDFIIIYPIMFFLICLIYFIK